MSKWDRQLNHLALYLEDGRTIIMSTQSETDSGLCNKARELMGTMWDKSKVKVAGTFITHRGL